MADLTSHFRFMAMATFVAFRALKNGETPVACLFVHDPTQEILSFGCNDTNRSLNGTRHAEFEAVDRILQEKNLLNKSQELVRDFFQDVSLYVTIEPCVMCALALKQLGVRRVFFGAANDRFGGNGTVIKIQEEDSYQSYGGIMRVEAIHLLRKFYIQENDTAPVPKIKKNKDIDGKEFPPNLDFQKYLTEELFVETYGSVRCDEFFRSPNTERELTPRISEGYHFANLIKAEDALTIPHLTDLYPRGDMNLEKDIQELAESLPRIDDNGAIDLEFDSLTGFEGRKRKYEDDSEASLEFNPGEV